MKSIKMLLAAASLCAAMSADAQTKLQKEMIDLEKKKLDIADNYVGG